MNATSRNCVHEQQGLVVRRPWGVLAFCLCASLTLPACSGLPTAARVVVTPFAVVRDIVDAPLVSLTNVFQTWADHSSPIPSVGVGVTAGSGGVRPGIGIGLGFYIWTPLSWIFGGVDWIVGRSIWPGWPTGHHSPWKTRQETWGSLYFPSTRELWRDEPGEAAESDAASPAG